MYNYKNLEITRLLPRKEGIFAFGKYPAWDVEYKFLVQADGKVKGKSLSGWLELSSDLSEFILEKVKFILREKSGLVYS